MNPATQKNSATILHSPFVVISDKLVVFVGQMYVFHYVFASLWLFFCIKKRVYQNSPQINTE